MQLIRGRGDGASKMAEPAVKSRAAQYRENAEALREMAARIRFDFNRRQQGLALADAFDRRAEMLEGLLLKKAAD